MHALPDYVNPVPALPWARAAATVIAAPAALSTARDARRHRGRRSARLAVLAGVLVTAGALADGDVRGASAYISLGLSQVDDGGVSVSLGGAAAPELLWQTQDESVFACAATDAPCEPQHFEQAANWATDMGFEIPLGADPLVYAATEASHGDEVDPSTRHLASTFTFFLPGQHTIAIAQTERRGTFTVSGSGIVAFAAPVDASLVTIGNDSSTYAFGSISAALRLSNLGNGRTVEDRLAATSDDPASDDEWASLDTGFATTGYFLVAALYFADGDTGEVSFFTHAVAEAAPLPPTTVPLPPGVALLALPAVVVLRRRDRMHRRSTRSLPCTRA